MRSPSDELSARRVGRDAPREALIPNANNVRLLTRLIEHVAKGLRDVRSLSEAMDCDPRTISYYTQAGEWLGLLCSDDHGRARLSQLGLEYVYAGKGRPKVYARAVWSNDFVVQLMQGRTEMPDNDTLTRFITQWVPDIAPTTARRRASAVRSLVQPALRFPRKVAPPATQMALDFGLRRRPLEAVAPVDARAGMEESPDAYRVVLRALLDHGELALGNLRAMLDRAGAGAAPVGNMVEMALRRGDARRAGERLVVTFGAVWRRDLAETVAGIALSDPHYRSYLEAVREAVTGDVGAIAGWNRLKPRFGAWDRRVFGEAVNPARLTADLDRILLGRPLESFTMAGDPGPDLCDGAGPFLEKSEEDGLLIALPSLSLLAGGVNAVNRALEARRRVAGNVGLPTIVDPREMVHSGIAHPGEAPLRSVPDTISLRYRAIRHIPHLAMTTALLVAHRRGGAPHLELEGGALHAWIGRSNRGELLFLLDEFASEQGWLVARRPRTGVTGEDVVEALEALGVAVRFGGTLVLSEDFFVRLQTDAEDRDLYDRLGPLSDRLMTFLESWTGQ